MAKLFVSLTIVYVFGVVWVEGLDKEATIAAFMAKMEDCKTEVGAKDGTYVYISKYVYQAVNLKVFLPKR